MKSLISWGELFIIIPVFLGLYYLGVFVALYRKDFLLKASSRKFDQQRPVPKEVQTSKSTDSTDGILYTQVLELMGDCKEVFTSVTENAMEHSQIVEALSIRLRKCPQIRGTSFQIAITNHIDQELQHRCNISLSAEDLDRLWEW